MAVCKLYMCSCWAHLYKYPAGHILHSSQAWGLELRVQNEGRRGPSSAEVYAAMCSCLGQIPLDDVDKQSSSSGVTWMPTSTGLDAFFISIGEGEGGLSTAFSKQRLPLHCFRLCSIKIRMSPNGKFIWHCPHVRRSWSPSGAPKGPWSGSSSVRMASRGSGENSRLLKCWGLPCLRRDMVGCGAGGGGGGGGRTTARFTSGEPG